MSALEIGLSVWLWSCVMFLAGIAWNESVRHHERDHEPIPYQVESFKATAEELRAWRAGMIGWFVFVVIAVAVTAWLIGRH